MIIKLCDALKVILCNEIPNHNFSFRIEFKDVTRKIWFGRGWVKDYNDGQFQTYWYKHEFCPTIRAGTIDEMLSNIVNDPEFRKGI